MNEYDDYPRLTLGVSSCLLGSEVRYDGGHKRDSFICDVLATLADFKPFCPEMSIGLGVPRPPIHWINLHGDVRVRGVKDPEHDHTDALYNAALKHHDTGAQLDGYIVKSKSPSCGMTRVKIHQADARSGPHRAGAFTEKMMQQFPALPFEEEGRLHDARLRENFVTRVLVYARWRRLLNAPLRKAALLAFHTRHKLILLAHNEAAYRRLGRVIAQMPTPLNASYLNDYIVQGMAALARPSTAKRHTNVLQHALGYFREHLDDDDRQELATRIDDYRLGRVPLSVPITLFQHHLRRHPVAYLREQLYFSPHPYELGLYNHI